MINWSIKKFENLSLHELYDIWNLRESVFVVEQKSIYLDADGDDINAHHVLAYKNNQLIAYARILPAESVSEPIKFGRVCTHAGHRKYGLGTQLVTKTIEFIKNHTQAKIIKIAAQTYLVNFYKQFGFTPITDSYLTEDGIEHTDMKVLI